MEKLLIPSMMCANFSSLKGELVALEEANVDMYHIDIMDGNFVPNFGMGLQDLEFIRGATDKLVDVHLMIQNPTNYIDLFAEKGVDIIYFHPEADIHPASTIQKIKSKGIKAGIAMNPGTSIHTVEPLLDLVDYVMLMTVNPGFAGQQYLPYVNKKISQLIQLKNEENHEFQVMVDGAISPEKIDHLSKLGVEGFILGTSSLFGKGASYTDIIQELRKDD